MPAPARRAALLALRAVTQGRSDLPATLARARRTLTDERDRALTAEIVTGTLRWLAALDHVIAHYAKRPVSKLDDDLRDLLRLSVYQLGHLERVPPRAVVNDAVDLTRRIGKASAAGLVNAVLRAVARDRRALPLPPRPPARGAQTQLMLLDYLTITLSHPRWLMTRWLDRYGFEATERWARFNNSPAPLALRVNVLRTSVGELKAQLEAFGVEVEIAKYVPGALIVRAGNPLTTPLATSGLFTVQDESSQLIAVFAGARPGDRTLDLCAAPGNKTLVLAGDMADRGMLVACDLRERRVELLRRTIASSRAHATRIVRSDALAPLPFLVEFDLVLLDAPCSGLGTIRSDPDIRWRRAPGDLLAFADTQLRLLENAASVVRAGGRLVYATCSSEPEENDEVVRRFLDRRRDFRMADPRAQNQPLPSGLDAVIDAAGYLRPLPWVHGLAGFFAAMLVKVKPL